MAFVFFKYFPGSRKTPEGTPIPRCCMSSIPWCNWTLLFLLMTWRSLIGWGSRHCPQARLTGQTSQASLSLVRFLLKLRAPSRMMWIQFPLNRAAVMPHRMVSHNRKFPGPYWSSSWADGWKVTFRVRVKIWRGRILRCEGSPVPSLYSRWSDPTEGEARISGPCNPAKWTNQGNMDILRQSYG